MYSLYAKIALNNSVCFTFNCKHDGKSITAFDVHCKIEALSAIYETDK